MKGLVCNSLLDMTLDLLCVGPLYVYQKPGIEFKGMFEMMH